MKSGFGMFELHFNSHRTETQRQSKLRLCAFNVMICHGLEQTVHPLWSSAANEVRISVHLLAMNKGTTRALGKYIAHPNGDMIFVSRV